MTSEQRVTAATGTSPTVTSRSSTPTTCGSGTAPRAVPVRAVDGVSFDLCAAARSSAWSGSPAAASRRSAAA